MNNLVSKNFKGQEIIFKEINGQHMVRINEVANFCGWTETAKSGNKSIMWRRVNKYLAELGIDTCADGDFIPEFVMYALIGKAKNAAATEFMLWVGQTLTELRTKGVVILDHAEDETIDFEKKFGKYRIRRTFTESSNIREDWEQLKELSKVENKAKRLTGVERIKLYNIAFSAIQDRFNSGLTELRASELMAMQELMTDIKSDTLQLSNRVNGGKKADLTKKLNAAYEYIYELEPSADDYICLEGLHGFTVNKQYEADITKWGTVRTDVKGRARLVKTEAYKNWITNFNTAMDKVKDQVNIDFNKHVDIYLYFDHMEKFDCSNFHKSFFDALSNYFNVDDNKFHLKMCDTSRYVNSYSEGNIFFCIRERDY